MDGSAGRVARSRSLTAAAIGLLLTIAVLTVPSVRFAYRSPNGHLVVETTVTLVAALVALLLYGRYRRSSSLGELLLVYAMSLFSVTALALLTLPWLLGEEHGRAASSWAALLVRLLGGGLVLLSALVPWERVHRVAQPWREVVVVAGSTVVLAASVVILSARFPDAVMVQVSAEESGSPSFDSPPAVMAAQIANLLCFAVAAVVLTRRASRTGDDLIGWFAAACALGVWARVNYLLFPSIYTDWFYTGDLLRLGFYLLLLVGAVREIRAYWEAQTEVAAEAERRRLARDLHDGVVQELGWIRSELSRGSGSSDAVRAAADRALAEARRALRALTEPADEALSSAVGRAVVEVGDRYDVPVRLALDDTVRVPPAHREQLVRVAREAVVNAVRHSGCPWVRVTLSPGSMTIGDDGRGFDPTYNGNGGFGLTSMRERAEAIGAVLRVDSSPGRGTCVEVTW